MRRPYLDDVEKRYLRELRKLEKRRKPFTHQAMCNAMGWNSVNSSWNMEQKLVTRGVLKASTRLARVPCPVVTSVGRRELGERTKRAA